ncbi:hypothetical protein [Caudoviricetes sp.]|nr:hypothetical protein [Caudoviricetes sp.]UOF79152.1 hypothetical protein [Caudoviricetes sp.]
MAIISMKDDDGNRKDKRWVAKAALYKVISIKDKQIAIADRAARGVYEELINIKKTNYLLIEAAARDKKRKLILTAIIVLLVFKELIYG